MDLFVEVHGGLGLLHAVLHARTRVTLYCSTLIKYYCTCIPGARWHRAGGRLDNA